MMRFSVMLVLTALLLISLAEPILATGLGGSSTYWGRNALEAYCVNHGGTPNGGYCYFPDGGYCDLKSFYNGTCPGKGYYEEAIWMSEAYKFLNSEDIYYTPGAYYNTPYAAYGNPYYSNYYYGYGPTYMGGYGTGWL